MAPLTAFQPHGMATLDPAVAGPPEIEFRDPALERIWSKVLEGGRLDHEDGLACLETWDLPALGRMADHAARRLHGDRVYFVLNRQLNPTNICVLTCGFCDFAARPRNDPHGYEMDWDEMLAHVDDEIREIHIVGGLHHKWPYEKYVEIVRRIREKAPDLTIKAWTAVEIDFFAKIGKRPIGRVLGDMVEAGLDALPGGGAEVFSERVRERLFKHKIGEREWFQVHDAAHRMGIPTNCTLLYGHIETYAERVDHVLKLREQQDRTGGFQAFIPLEYQLGTTKIVERQASAIEDLRTIAMSRLVFDNVPHVKSYWVMLGEQTAEIALNFGASDLDGTIGHEKIAHYALATSAAGHTRDTLTRMIRAAGKTPVERDALYREVEVQG
ncbi:MAG TPA: aminofutalosine synthase MqnE [Gemmatimonadota bacterium]|nr:aminofutalosine synthase MqnE [Gemmatimonadota bacterium]